MTARGRRSTRAFSVGNSPRLTYAAPRLTPNVKQTALLFSIDDKIAGTFQKIRIYFRGLIPLKIINFFKARCPRGETAPFCLVSDAIRVIVVTQWNTAGMSCATGQEDKKCFVLIKITRLAPATLPAAVWAFRRFSIRFSRNAHDRRRLSYNNIIIVFPSKCGGKRRKGQIRLWPRHVTHVSCVRVGPPPHVCFYVYVQRARTHMHTHYTDARTYTYTNVGSFMRMNDEVCFRRGQERRRLVTGCGAPSQQTSGFIVGRGRVSYCVKKKFSHSAASYSNNNTHSVENRNGNNDGFKKASCTFVNRITTLHYYNNNETHITEN